MCFSNSTLEQKNCSSFAHKWCAHKAYDWYDNNGWIVGCNYIPATAINQLEMWQAETFDLACIDKELAWAEDLGFNAIRVFLHHLLWEQDPVGFINRIHQFLTVADKHNIKTMFVLFDGVWDPYPKLGEQPGPKLNVHNSGWVQSPGYDVLKDTDAYDALRGYVEGVVGSFKTDHRVLIWDLFNEPDNTNTASYNDTYHVQKAELALNLLKKTFEWARALHPVQPLTAAPWKDDWSDDEKISELDNFMFSNSDIISFHSYEDKDALEKRLQYMQRFHRPLLCTEYMARHLGSTFYEIMPLLKQYNVGAFNWGLVAGKTQTHCAWDSWQTANSNEPEVWFHDIFRNNGEPFDKAEVEFIQKMLKQKIEVYQKVA